MKTITTQQCLLLAAAATMLTTAANAATVVYDFNTDLSASTSGLTAGDVSYAVGTQSDGASPAEQRAWDTVNNNGAGDFMLNLYQRGLGNSGILDANLTVIAAATLQFTLDPNASESLDFTGQTLNFNQFAYSDASNVSFGYKIWADTGSGFAAVGVLQTVDLTYSTDTESRLKQTDTTTNLAGIGLDNGAINSQVTALSFDISSLGVIAANQNVTFAIAMASKLNNQTNFANGVDDIVVTVNTVAVPEPSSSAFLGLAGLALILRRRK